MYNGEIISGDDSITGKTVANKTRVKLHLCFGVKFARAFLLPVNKNNPAAFYNRLTK
jgi:hypothetical protein